MPETCRSDWSFALIPASGLAASVPQVVRGDVSAGDDRRRLSVDGDLPGGGSGAGGWRGRDAWSVRRRPWSRWRRGRGKGADVAVAFPPGGVCRYGLSRRRGPELAGGVDSMRAWGRG